MYNASFIFHEYIPCFQLSKGTDLFAIPPDYCIFIPKPLIEM